MSEVVGCFNCQFLNIAMLEIGKQHISMDSRNYGKHVATMHNS